jgi:hypothetical protein
MAMMDVIDDLDRCKIALQYVAERQSDSLTTVLELLLGRLEDAIGQVQTQLHQCPCPVHAHARETSVPVPRRGLTMVPGPVQTPRRPAPVPPPRIGPWGMSSRTLSSQGSDSP